MAGFRPGLARLPAQWGCACRGNVTADALQGAVAHPRKEEDVHKDNVFR